VTEAGSGGARRRPPLAFWFVVVVGVMRLAVPALALAGHWLVAAAMMLLERTGKGIRNPPRDAMLSHAAHENGPGWAFGLHEALDETGAALGTALAKHHILAEASIPLLSPTESTPSPAWALAALSTPGGRTCCR
jgi:hypothetical protein